MQLDQRWHDNHRAMSFWKVTNKGVPV